MKKSLFSVLVIAVAMFIAIPAYAADFDGDAVADYADNCPLNPNGMCQINDLFCDVDGDLTVTANELGAGHQADWNENGLGDACEDFDGDAIMDYDDNCPGVVNFEQDPAACADYDGDLVYDEIDNCLEDYNPGQEDRDIDGVGDACDNCMFAENTDQADSDDDGFGDACIKDFDDDGIENDEDNCPTTPNPGQENTGGSYRGDACEPVDLLPSESDDVDDSRLGMSSGTHSCSIAVAPQAIGLSGNVLAVLLLMATAAIVSDFRRVRR